MNTQNAAYYLSKITSQYQTAPKMLVWLTANLGLFQDIQTCLAGFAAAFDIDTAVGAQLDVLGVILGVSRTVAFQPSSTTAFRVIPVGNGPSGIYYDFAGSVWVANQTDNTVTKITESTGTIVGTFNVGTSPTGVFVAFSGSNHIWVANQGSNNVTKLDSAGTVIGTYAVGTAPVSIAFDGTNIWVANQGSNNVTKLVESTGALVGTYAVGTAPAAIYFSAIGSGLLWVANSGSGNVTRLNAMTGATVGSPIAVGTTPSAIVYDSGTSTIWVANKGSNNVTKLNSSGALVGTYPVGNNPIGIDVGGPTGTDIWVANSTDNTVSRLNVSTGALIGTSAVGATNPWGVSAIPGASVWTANFGSASITKLTYNVPVSPVLDDTTYRTVLRARIFQNHWNGLLGSLQAAWAVLFPGGAISINDGQNMTATIILSGAFTSIIQHLIFNGYIVPRPQAVQYTFVFPSLPMLGFDQSSGFIAGVDLGHFT